MEFVWQSAWDFVAQHFYVSPFWWWVFVGAIVIVAATAAGWFFSALRSLAGAIVFAVIAGLVGYRRGETDAEAHARPAKDRAAPAKQQQQNWWTW